MTRFARIEIGFTGFWLSGLGAARGRDLDDVTHRDRYGCPAMPMSQVKGQLRESATRLAGAALCGWSTPVVRRLFGTETSEAALAFRGEATLSPAALSHFGTDPSDRARLFRRLPATRIGALGAAEDKTLRAIEAAVPVTLHGAIEAQASEDDGAWVGLLDAACAATLAFGKLKNDGYGRAVARIVVEAR